MSPVRLALRFVWWPKLEGQPPSRHVMKLPERLVGVVVEADGRPRGLALPSLDERGAADAWRAALGKGPYYVQFAARDTPADLGRVQRLARLGEVWLDCALPGPDVALDLLIAGAARLVVWEDGDLLETIGDSAVRGWDARVPLEQAIAAAKAHDLPILATQPLPSREDPGLYQAPPGPWSGRFEVTYVGNPDNLADDAGGTAGPRADAASHGDDVVDAVDEAGKRA